MNTHALCMTRPTPNPSQEGSKRSFAGRRFPSWEGLGVGSWSQCTASRSWGHSMNRPFGVPALAGKYRQKVGHPTGFLTIELVVAMAILLVAMIPLSYAFFRERQLSRACYNRAVAMEIVDGELEVLQAGQWRAFSEGSQRYSTHAESATNLPSGRFILTRTGKQLRLEWLPDKRRQGGRVSREATLP